MPLLGGPSVLCDPGRQVWFKTVLKENKPLLQVSPKRYPGIRQLTQVVLGWPYNSTEWYWWWNAVGRRSLSVSWSSFSSSPILSLSSFIFSVSPSHPEITSPLSLGGAPLRLEVRGVRYAVDFTYRGLRMYFLGR